VGRQVLGSACLGEIQLGLIDRKGGQLEVEVIRARELMTKPGAKILPGTVSGSYTVLLLYFFNFYMHLDMVLSFKLFGDLAKLHRLICFPFV